MSSETVVKLCMASVGLLSAIMGFWRWFKEYKLKQELERFKILQAYREKFRIDPVISQVHQHIQDNTQPAPSVSNLFFYLGQFEEIEILIERKLFDREVANVFFGFYAKAAVAKFSDLNWTYWAKLNRFLQYYDAWLENKNPGSK